MTTSSEPNFPSPPSGVGRVGAFEVTFDEKAHR
jgi:hypothetical protein